MRTFYVSFLFIAAAVATAPTETPSQKQMKPAGQGKPSGPVLFAVVNDGTRIEPIAYLKKGKLEPPVGGDAEPAQLADFGKAFYKSGTAFRLIFGGADAGVVTVTEFSSKADCSKNVATVAVTSTKVTLKGARMGLATNAPSNPKAAGLRRPPNAAERAEAEALVRAEFVKNKLAPKELRSQNLTAIDVDGDGKVELVGSYWIEIDKLTRALLFFIADKRQNGKYFLGWSEYRRIDQQGVMSHDIRDVDQGVYHELMLDYFDVDGDGVAEIFTTEAAFEGSDFHVYRRSGGKWSRSYDFSNYHCAY